MTVETKDTSFINTQYLTGPVGSVITSKYCIEIHSGVTFPTELVELEQKTGKSRELEFRVGRKKVDWGIRP